MGFRPWGDPKGPSWLLGRAEPRETHMKALMEVVNRLATRCPSRLTPRDMRDPQNLLTAFKRNFKRVTAKSSFTPLIDQAAIQLYR